MRGKILIKKSSLQYKNYTPTVIRKTQTQKWATIQEASDSSTTQYICFVKQHHMLGMHYRVIDYIYQCHYGCMYINVK